MQCHQAAAGLHGFRKREPHRRPGLDLPRCLRQVGNGFPCRDQLALTGHVVEILLYLGNIAGRGSVVLPAGAGLFSGPAAVALVYHEVGGAVRLDRLGCLQDHVGPGLRFADHVQHVGAGRSVRFVAFLQKAQGGTVGLRTPVVRIEDHVFGADALEVVGGQVKAATADVDICLAEFNVLVPEQGRDLFDGSLGAVDRLGYRRLALLPVQPVRQPGHLLGQLLDGGLELRLGRGLIRLGFGLLPGLFLLRQEAVPDIVSLFLFPLFCLLHRVEHGCVLQQHAQGLQVLIHLLAQTGLAGQHPFHYGVDGHLLVPAYVAVYLAIQHVQQRILVELGPDHLLLDDLPGLLVHHLAVDQQLPVSGLRSQMVLSGEHGEHRNQSVLVAIFEVLTAGVFHIGIAVSVKAPRFLDAEPVLQRRLFPVALLVGVGLLVLPRLVAVPVVQAHHRLQFFRQAGLMIRDDEVDVRRGHQGADLRVVDADADVARRVGELIPQLLHHLKGHTLVGIVAARVQFAFGVQPGVAGGDQAHVEHHAGLPGHAHQVRHLGVAVGHGLVQGQIHDGANQVQHMHGLKVGPALHPGAGLLVQGPDHGRGHQLLAAAGGPHQVALIVWRSGLLGLAPAPVPQEGDEGVVDGIRFLVARQLGQTVHAEELVFVELLQPLQQLQLPFTLGLIGGTQFLVLFVYLILLLGVQFLLVVFAGLSQTLPVPLLHGFQHVPDPGPVLLGQVVYHDRTGVGQIIVDILHGVEAGCLHVAQSAGHVDLGAGVPQLDQFLPDPHALHGGQAAAQLFLQAFGDRLRQYPLAAQGGVVDGELIVFVRVGFDRQEGTVVPAQIGAVVQLLLELGHEIHHFVYCVEQFVQIGLIHNAGQILAKVLLVLFHGAQVEPDVVPKIQFADQVRRQFVRRQFPRVVALSRKHRVLIAGVRHGVPPLLFAHLTPGRHVPGLDLAGRVPVKIK